MASRDNAEHTISETTLEQTSAHCRVILSRLMRLNEKAEARDLPPIDEDLLMRIEKTCLHQPGESVDPQQVKTRLDKLQNEVEQTPFFADAERRDRETEAKLVPRVRRHFDKLRDVYDGLE